MKKVKLLSFVFLGLLTVLATSCGGDDDDSSDSKGGFGETTSTEVTMEKSLVGTWESRRWRGDGVELVFSYNIDSSKKGRWTRKQSDGYTAWYDFNWSANYSEGQYWFHMYITANSANMVEDWGVQYKVGRQVDDSFIIADNILYIGGMEYTKQ